jgi:CHRD domain
MPTYQEDYMKVSGMFRAAIPAVVASAAFALAGCQTMESAWDSTKTFVTGSNVALSGAEEVPPVTTSASGSGTITVKDDKSVSGGVKTTGVVGTAAHIHTGAAGKNGPVIIPLTKSSDGNTWSVPEGAKLTDAQYNEYKAGNLYVNVHSAAHKGGEVRGQLKP